MSNNLRHAEAFANDHIYPFRGRPRLRPKQKLHRAKQYAYCFFSIDLEEIRRLVSFQGVAIRPDLSRR